MNCEEMNCEEMNFRKTYPTCSKLQNSDILKETAVHAGGVFDGVFCVVLFPTRCLR